MDYLYSRIEDNADQIPHREIRELAKDFANLMHDLEWYLSGDSGQGNWIESLHKFREKWLRSGRGERLRGYVDDMVESNKKELLELIGEATYCKDCRHLSPCEYESYGKCELHRGYLDHRYTPSCEEYESKECSK